VFHNCPKNNASLRAIRVWSAEYRFPTGFYLEKLLLMLLPLNYYFFYKNQLKMLDLLFQGGPLLMGTLSILLLWILVLSVKQGMRIFDSQSKDSIKQINRIKTIGAIALVIGVLGQLIGLYSAFGLIEASEQGISQQILMGGLRVSLITSIYGLIIFLITRTITLVFNYHLQV